MLRPLIPPNIPVSRSGSMTNSEASDTENPQTTKTRQRCPHCDEWHTIEKVTEPGWERQIYCPRTGVLG